MLLRAQQIFNIKLIILKLGLFFPLSQLFFVHGEQQRIYERRRGRYLDEQSTRTICQSLRLRVCIVEVAVHFCIGVELLQLIAHLIQLLKPLSQLL